jgi:GTP-binding protein YchF
VERLGIVGLPNAGKSALFNALTGGSAVVAPHPFSTTATQVGVAQVPDHRLRALADMSRSKRVVPATVELVDIAGLVAGSAGGEGLGNRFLAGIREVDAVLLLLRAFEDQGVPGGADPLDDLHTLELELVLADAASAEGQLERRRKGARGDLSQAAAAADLEAALAVLHDGTPLYRAGLDAELQSRLGPFSLLTTKPVLAVVNLGEARLGEADEVVKPVAADLAGVAEVLGLPVQLELEVARMEAGEQDEMRGALGLGEGVRARVVRAAHHVLGRQTFLTTGEKESRAWTFRAGATARECAGLIHSDLERGFIRAEVIRWDELVELGSWAAARQAGRARLEGKDYPVVDGDVLDIRFNV